MDELTLDHVYRMFSPLDEVQGGNIESIDSLESVRRVLQSNSRGVLNPEDLVSEFVKLVRANASSASAQSVASVYSSAFEDDHLYFSAETGEQLTYQRLIDVDNRDDYCVTMVHEPRITPLTDNTAPVEKFLNFMPPTVLSMCSPYLDIEFVNTRQSDGRGLYLLTPSTLKFLLGGASIDSLSEHTQKIASADIKLSGETQVSHAGLELFTTPQTLQNFTNEQGDRYIAPLDMSRPLATLESVAISVRGTTGTLFYKTAQVLLKVHDKSRLAEFADVLQPISAPNTSMWLTYGWRHPDDNSPYGKFINEHMCVREAYGLINSTFSFDAAGQVSVTLNLSAKGAVGLHNMTLAAAQNKDRFNVATAPWAKLSKDIAAWKKRTLGIEDEEDNRKDILGHTLINAAAEFTFPSMNSAEIRKALGDLRIALNNTKVNDDEVRSLLNDLESYYETQGKNFSYVESVKRTVNVVVKEKFRELNSSLDPFLVSSTAKLERLATARKFVKESTKRYQNLLSQIVAFKKNNKASSVVSFGKIITTMLCPALAHIEGVKKYELFFYNINDRAGYASGINLAEFPIDVVLFKAQYEQHLEAVASETITVEQFVKLVVDSQISDFRAIPYGFRNTGVVNLGSKSDTDAPGTLTQRGAAQYPFLSLQFNENRGEFVLPQIEVHLETKQARSSESNQNPVDEPILRIHFFDKTLNPYPDAKKRVDKNSPLSRKAVLDMAQKNTPLLIPGMNSSAIFEANVATKGNAQLLASQMMRMNSGRNVQATPRGSGVGGLPVAVTPVALTMRTLGCPAINYAQMFFVDMNTGTTIDNRYGVVNITHDIKPGSFFTTLQLALYDSYAKFIINDPVDIFKQTQ